MAGLSLDRLTNEKGPFQKARDNGMSPADKGRISDEYSSGSWEELMRWDDDNTLTTDDGLPSSLPSPEDTLSMRKGSSFNLSPAERSTRSPESPLVEIKETNPFVHGDDQHTLSFDEAFSSLAFAKAQEKDPSTIFAAMPDQLQSSESTLQPAAPPPTHSHMQGFQSTRLRPLGITTKPEGRKRKFSSEDDGSLEEVRGRKPVKKNAHNVIEKKYRNNLNDKISALRDSVPSLRAKARSVLGIEDKEDQPELDGLTPAHKLNKGIVLSKATEYIGHLEGRSRRLETENSSLKARIAALEVAVASRPVKIEESPTAPGEASSTRPVAETEAYEDIKYEDVKGMIKVPEDFARMRAAGRSQAHYAPPAEVTSSTQRGSARAQNSQGGFASKLMIGSLASLMMLEGFTETDDKSSKGGSRGLSGLPFELLTRLGGHSDVASFDDHFTRFHLFILLLRITCLFAAFLYVAFPSIFDLVYRKRPRHPINLANLVPVPSPASPLVVRRQAWLTSIQTVWVPRHNIFLEAWALISESSKLLLWQAIGAGWYEQLTGSTEDYEIARVKAWDIGIDALLAGGDAEISKTRLVLLLIVSGTLPESPARLMLKALHVRILLWEVANAGYFGYYVLEKGIAAIARWQWNKARSLQRQQLKHSFGKINDTGILPDYLAILLEMDCDKVLMDPVIQRAYNLAWNNPTNENTEVSDEGMDSVVEDFKIRSPLDALAAWWSSLIVHNALIAAVEESKTNYDDSLKLALKVAPPGSFVQMRGVAACSLLARAGRLGNLSYSTALSDKKYNILDTLVLPPASAAATTPGIRLAMHCARAMQKLDENPHMTQAILNQTNRLFAPDLAPGLDVLGTYAIDQYLTRLNRGTGGIEGSPDTLRLRKTLKSSAVSAKWIDKMEDKQDKLEQERRVMDLCRALLGKLSQLWTDNKSIPDVENES